MRLRARDLIYRTEPQISLLNFIYGRLREPLQFNMFLACECVIMWYPIHSSNARLRIRIRQIYVRAKFAALLLLLQAHIHRLSQTSHVRC